MIKIDDYIPIVGKPVIDDLKRIGSRLEGKVIQNINSTTVGGGVAEILNRMIPLLKQLGVDMRWDVIKGGEQFFEVTKKFHNVLHGKKDDVGEKDFDVFMETTKLNLNEVNTYGDVVFIHDPQPIGLVSKRNDKKWIWRCHIDVSDPHPKVWDFLKGFIMKYYAMVLSAPSFSQRMPIRQFLISPSIDPLSDKNRELGDDFIAGVMEKYKIPTDKPIITQISRFDRLKDPLGCIKAYKMVKRYHDCRLVLAGGGATDDPEGVAVYEEVKNESMNDPDIHVILMQQNDLDVNAIQRASTIIMQKSLKEGFGLTVSEALWKAKPVVASFVGGIPLQIKHKYSGLLCRSIEGASFALKQLLGSPEYAGQLGENGREHVRNNFLVTRHARNYMLMFLSLYNDSDIVNL